MIKTHLSLNVSDLNKSVEFYSAFFGAPPHKVRPGYANFDLADPPLKFALVENPARVGLGSLDHLGFLVASHGDLEAAKGRLKAAGLATFDEADTTCCYAKQDKFWAHDPDGNEWEVYLLLDDLMDDHDHDHTGHPLNTLAGETGCCDSNGTQPSTTPFSVIAPAHRCCEESQTG